MYRAMFVALGVLLLGGAIAATENPIDKGSLFLDGTVFFRSQSGDLFEDDGDAFTTYGVGTGLIGPTLTFEVSPTVGYFVAPNIFVGGQIAVLGFSQGDLSATALAFGPTVGYFFNVNPTRTEVRGSIYPYIRGFGNFGQLSEDFLGADIDIWQYGGKGGAIFMLSNAVGLDAAVGFQGDSWKPDGADESITGTTIWLGAGITAFIY